MISLNGVDISSLDCSLVRGLREDFPSREHMEVGTDTLTPEEILTSISLIGGEVPERDILMMLRFLSYVGYDTSEVKRVGEQSKNNVNIFHIGSLYGMWFRKGRFLSREDYYTLLDTYSSSVLMKKLKTTEILPYEPSERFLELFDVTSIVRRIIDREDLKNNCFIAGGLLANCHMGLASARDIDIFCINNSHNLLIERIKECMECQCFVDCEVVTILVRGSPTSIQITPRKETSCEGVMYSFDLACCKLAYYMGGFHAMADFHSMISKGDGKSFKQKTPVKQYRLLKYRRMGFKIDYEGEFVPCLKTLSDSDEAYYTWTHESPERLLCIVRGLFGFNYKPLTGPLPAVENMRESYFSNTDNTDMTEEKVDLPGAGMPFYTCQACRVVVMKGIECRVHNGKIYMNEGVVDDKLRELYAKYYSTLTPINAVTFWVSIKPSKQVLESHVFNSMTADVKYKMDLLLTPIVYGFRTNTSMKFNCLELMPSI